MRFLYVTEDDKDKLTEAIQEITGFEDEENYPLVQRVAPDRYCSELDIPFDEFREIIEILMEEGVDFSVEGDTMALRCLRRLEAYETDHPSEGFITNPWTDIFYSDGEWEIDERATERADPAGNNEHIVFLDGSELKWDDRSQVWVEK